MHAKDIQLVYGGGTNGLMGEVARERVKLGGPETVIGVTPSALVGDERKSAADPDRRLEAMGLESERQPSFPRGTLSQLVTGFKNLLDSTPSGSIAPTAASQSFEPVANVTNLPTDPLYGRAVVVPSLSARKAHMIRLVQAGAPGSGFLALPGGFGTLDEVAEVVTLRQHGMHSKGVVLVNIDGFWDGLMTWLQHALDRGFVQERSRDYLKISAEVEEAVELLE
jgi:uncharacterized protein (TIGR00730 family)